MCGVLARGGVLLGMGGALARAGLVRDELLLEVGSC